MSIQTYLDLFKIDSKCFLLLAVSPKGEYPLKSYDNEFHNYVKNILPTEKYIGVYETNRKEILQDVAFKLFTMPLIGDSYDLPNMTRINKPRANKNEIIAFFAVKEYMDVVPYGEQTENEAIETGIVKAEKFLKKYPIDKYDVVISKQSRNEDGCQHLIDMEFDFENHSFHFNKVYVY
ncbi:MAG: hypothetical protein K0R18_590 [Bacillales bacterium]|jgi:hypothetical protein|nr:hypothetical protein [Bacillales bacterium]